MRSSVGSEQIVVADMGSAVERAHRGEPDVLADIMRQHNRRMFRIARAILRNDAEAEDIVQDAFVKAFTELGSLREPSSAAAWLAKITANLAISRVRLLKRRGRVVLADGELEDRPDDMETDQYTPERLAAMGDVRRLLENAIDRLPDGFREVFMLRVVEHMSVEETATTLGVLAADGEIAPAPRQVHAAERSRGTPDGGFTHRLSLRRRALPQGDRCRACPLEYANDDFASLTSPVLLSLIYANHDGEKNVEENCDVSRPVGRCHDHSCAC